ncbi:hypothetical protein [Asticcacaulis biprosthecium]|uniref:hypothetical protein n=1 Tax=Asticcacaulis biprosthecium TaxID=76891 RepID=UPI0005907EEB|nr:hypothetical protein [Asticcacaulis biprosthecium]
MRTKQEEADGDVSALLRLLRRPEQWVKNAELADALGFVNNKGNKSVAGHWKDLDDVLRPSDTKLEGGVRLFSKRAAIQCAIRATTANAKAFKFWAADTLVSVFSEPARLVAQEREAFAAAIAQSVIDLITRDGDTNS